MNILFDNQNTVVWYLLYHCLQVSYRFVTYLLQPKKGGIAQQVPMTQVKMTAAKAWLLPNLKAPNGLQITRYLSKDKTARDQDVTRPEQHPNS